MLCFLLWQFYDYVFQAVLGGEIKNIFETKDIFNYYRRSLQFRFENNFWG